MTRISIGFPNRIPWFSRPHGSEILDSLPVSQNQHLMRCGIQQESRIPERAVSAAKQGFQGWNSQLVLTEV